jgi:hypothetical protein
MLFLQKWYYQRQQINCFGVVVFFSKFNKHSPNYMEKKLFLKIIELIAAEFNMNVNQDLKLSHDFT